MCRLGYDLYSSDLRFFRAYTFGTFFALKCGQKPCKSVNGNLQAKTVVLRTAKRIHSEEYVSVCKIKLLQRCKQRVAYAGHNFS